DKSGNESPCSTPEAIATPTAGTSGTVNTPDIRADRSNDTWSNDDDVRFEWDDTSDYTYYWVLDSSSGTTPDSGNSSTGDSYKEMHVEDGTRYFHLRAKNSSGTWGSPKHFTIRIDKNNPSRVSGLNVTLRTNGDVDLDWDEPSDSGGSGIKNYLIYRSTKSNFDIDSSSNYQRKWTVSSTSDTDDTSKNDGTTYYYRVRAYDGADNGGEESEDVSVKYVEGGGEGLKITIEAPEFVSGETEIKVIGTEDMDNLRLRLNMNGEWKTIVSNRDDVREVNETFDFLPIHEGKEGYFYVTADDQDGTNVDARKDFVVDGTAPEAEWNAPGSGTDASGEVTLEASASDMASGVEKVVFYYFDGDWKTAGEATSSSGGVYSYNWQMANLDGEYRVKAEAIDKAGNKIETSEVTLRITRVEETVEPETTDELTVETVTTTGTETTGTGDEGTASGILGGEGAIGYVLLGGGLLAGVVVILAIVAALLFVGERRSSGGGTTELEKAFDRVGNTGGLFSGLGDRFRPEPEEKFGKFAYRGERE
ncbi:hypothetical protein KKH30_00945, partial [Candidatus Micrarchaeota archaeon]|nr:hypothetical protein [Candidatus Micrarchaeota archaeon]MBU1939309.1 hypothetical protein [Candidatus Micrarchaeota archaeon]